MSPRVALGVLLYAATCVGCAPQPQPAPPRERNGSCDPVFGSDDVLVAPDDPRGLADSGLIIIAKWDGERWRDCGVRQ